MHRLNHAPGFGIASLLFFAAASTGLGSTVFSNTTSITIPATTGGVSLPVTADAYPSEIAVSGMVGTITGLSVTLDGWTDDGTAANPADLFFLLVGPGGEAYDFLGDAGSTRSFTNVTLTLTDSAATNLTSGITAGSFKPTVLGTSCPAFPAPAPTSGVQCATPQGTTTFADLFNGKEPDGTWSLYIFDDTAGDTASTISRGWSLALDSTGGYVAPVVPEPSSWTLVGLAMGLFAFLRQRRLYRLP